MEKLGTYSVMEFRAVCKMSNIPATSTGCIALRAKFNRVFAGTAPSGRWPMWSHCSSKCGRRPRAGRRSSARRCGITCPAKCLSVRQQHSALCP
jgi:hypothetical protein